MNRALERSVIVVGTGPAGLVTALALAREGASVTLVGEAAPEPRGRTIALFDGSVRLLAELGVWDRLAPKAAPLRKLRIIDDTDNLFRWPELCFEASEIGLTPSAGISRPRSCPTRCAGKFPARKQSASSRGSRATLASAIRRAQGRQRRGRR